MDTQSQIQSISTVVDNSYISNDDIMEQIYNDEMNEMYNQWLQLAYQF